MNKKIILASASPRRRELLSQIGLDFEVVVSETEEKITSTEPAKVVEELSAQKAEAVWEKLAGSDACQVPDHSADRTQEGCDVCNPEQKSGETTITDIIVLGADTVVASDGKILGKPADTEAAVAMLTMLQGSGHEVYTGVTILYEENGERKTLTFHEKTTVHFYPMTDAQIREYVATGDPMDKAGAYGIQGLCARYISDIAGDYNNVVGLPVGRVYQELHGLQTI
ncbi:MAG: Maf family protein [Acetatifactor sp.]|nr:Maf family protein [Acetatifactor sp.]